MKECTRVITASDGRMIKILHAYGHEYWIIESSLSRKNSMHPEPCFMGFEGFALYACKKLTGYQKKLNN